MGTKHVRNNLIWQISKRDQNSCVLVFKIHSKRHSFLMFLIE